MSTLTTDQLRHRMRERARKRQRAERCSYSRALFLVRRAEILKLLNRHQGKTLRYQDIARATAVPIGTVRQICQHLKRQSPDMDPSESQERQTDATETTEQP